LEAEYSLTNLTAVKIRIETSVTVSSYDKKNGYNFTSCDNIQDSDPISDLSVYVPLLSPLTKVECCKFYSGKDVY